MINVQKRINAFIGNQQRCPTGPIGALIGAQMARQHRLETDWSIGLLEIQPTDAILEIGFGAGRAIQLMAREARQGRVSGIDLSSAMVNTARRRNMQAVRSGQVILQESDVMALPFEDELFNKVISIHTFYFWADPCQAIDGIRRVLKSGGKLVLTLSTGKVGDEQKSGLEHFQSVLEERVLPHMQQNGFSQVELKEGPVARGYNALAVLATKS